MTNNIVKIAEEQLALIPVIEREIESCIVYQREKDGYFNATEMCKAAGKKFHDYSRLSSTSQFLEELSKSLKLPVAGIPATGLIQSFQGFPPHLQGTWVHPQVAVNLAQWLSPQFAVLVTEWFWDWIEGRTRQHMPYHIRRYLANRSRIPHTHFSILNEMIFELIGPMELVGYTLPDHLMPDISEGKMFATYLRKEVGIDPTEMPKYRHDYEDGRICYPRMYKNQFQPHFKEHFHEIWIPRRSFHYFEEKDPNALPYLEEVLALPEPKREKSTR